MPSKYIKNYSFYLITESLSDEGIKHLDVPKTQKHILKTLTQLFRIDKKSVNFIGSAGKGLSEDLAYNINVCIDKNKLIENNNLEESEMYDFLLSQFKRLGYKSEKKEEEDRLIIAWPTQGTLKQGIVEASIQISEHMSWVSFSRFSPNINEGESKFSGKYRECLFKSIAESLKQKVISYFDDKDTVKEFKEYSFDVHKGLFSITKTFEGKNGILNKSQLVKNSKKLITNEPSEFIKIIFGESLNSDNFMTFEKCWEEFQNNKSLKKKKEKIINKFKRTLINMNLIVPENLM